jgi:hypothetical protein
MRSTKYLSAAVVLVLCSPAVAQDMASDSSRIISDPLYLPLQGEFYGATTYQYGSLSRDNYDNTGARSSSTNVTSNTLDQTFLYGITDDFALHFNWGYDIARDASTHPVSGGDIKRDSSGWTDPEFGLVYRLMDQKDNPLTLDLRADYSPDAFPGKSASLDDEGTVARGGQMADFGATLGHEGPMFTIAAKFDAIWLDTAKMLNQVSGDSTLTNATWNYRLGLDTQTRLSDQVSVNAGVGHTFTNNGEVFNETTGLFHFTDGRDVTDVSAGLNYQFVPNTLVGTLGYQHNFYQNVRNIFPTSPTDNNFARNKDEDLVGVTMRYAFH